MGLIGSSLAELPKALCSLGDLATTLLAYEAGYAGYVLSRRLAEHSWRFQVTAPSKVPRKPGERTKTDRCEALSLASSLRAGERTAVQVPDAVDEAMRALSRAREAAVHARQHFKAMLLRHAHRYQGKTAKGLAHERYLASITFKHSAEIIG